MTRKEMDAKFARMTPAEQDAFLAEAEHLLRKLIEEKRHKTGKLNNRTMACLMGVETYATSAN